MAKYTILKKQAYMPRRWTKQAIHCYKIGGVCSKCLYYVELESTDVCQVKNAVIELVRVLGKPDEYWLLLEDDLKRCKICGKIKHLDEFNAAGSPSKSTYCKKCSAKIGTEWRKNAKISNNNKNK